MLSVFLIGLGLAMDAFAVSVGSGIAIPRLRIFYAIRASLFFGLFQFIMPLAGWYLGHALSAFIRAYDHWVAFGLLVLIGGRMIREGLSAKGAKKARDAKDAKSAQGSPDKPGTRGEEKGKPPPDIRGLGALFGLAIATSIDALAVGVSFSVLAQNIWTAAAVIGGTTFIVCLTGFEFGVRLRRRMGFVFETWAPVAGGIILIAIGLRIVVEHLFFP
ncbi:MAG: manganese efflux pump MntP family protein [Treponema sp.]|jgi:putative Mn2+ efflux pump MntP|nr:manganese efflux pump MntP family protein [Treponema sp.]